MKFINRNKKYFIIIIFTLVFFSLNKFTIALKAAKTELSCADYSMNEDLTNAELDKIIAICDQEIQKQKEQLKEKQEETTGVKYEIKKLDKNIKISQSYINAKIAKANKLKKNINNNKQDILSLEEKLSQTIKKLVYLVRLKYEVENYSQIETIFSIGTISDFFSNIETVEILRKKISNKVNDIKEEKESLEDLSMELAERESAERSLAMEKTQEREKIKKNKKYKDELLQILKKETGQAQEKIKNIEEIKQRILRKKFKLASGEKISFGDALNLIQPYESKFKMDTAFVLAILFQESGWGGNIGGNIGRCTYNQKNSHGNSKGGYTVMRSTQKTNFLKIMNGLGLDPEKQPVSCPISKDGAYGGAMGPAQFMPNTWMGIRNSAAKILGVRAENLSPFMNQDAFMASAAYLKQNYYSKSCSNYATKYAHISPQKTLRERCAAAMYYAGGNWWNYRFTYGESVVKRANKFREDIKTLQQ